MHNSKRNNENFVRSETERTYSFFGAFYLHLIRCRKVAVQTNVGAIGFEGSRFRNSFLARLCMCDVYFSLLPNL